MMGEQELIERVKILEGMMNCIGEYICVAASLVNDPSLQAAHNLIHDYQDKYEFLETPEGMLKRLEEAI